jgi:nucleoside-diphosphate-sugar epimerase
LKKLIVTGALGYIGTVLVPYLEQKGYQCLAYDTGFFKDCTILSSQTKVIYKDVRDLSETDLQGASVLIHLAGIANDPLKKIDPHQVYDPVRQYTFRLAKICKQKKIKFIFASSCSVYGAAEQKMSDEDSPTNPVTPYSLNKLQIEQDLAELTDGDFQPILLRFATVFGFSPRLRFDIVVNMFAGMAYSNKEIVLNSKGEVWRPFVHIQDVCNAVSHAIEHESSCTQTPLILNVGDSKINYRILDVAEIVSSLVRGCKISFLKNHDELISDRKVNAGIDQRDYQLSFEKIKKAFSGFQCEWSLEKGLVELLNQFDMLKLDNVMFRNLNFYRLQKMEQLLEEGRLTSELRWN